MTGFIKLPMLGTSLRVRPEKIIALIAEDNYVERRCWVHVEGASVAFIVTLDADEVEMRLIEFARGKS